MVTCETRKKTRKKMLFECCEINPPPVKMHFHSMEIGSSDYGKGMSDLWKWYSYPMETARHPMEMVWLPYGNGVVKLWKRYYQPIETIIYPLFTKHLRKE